MFAIEHETRALEFCCQQLHQQLRDGPAAVGEAILEKKCREAMDKIAREVSEHYTIGYYPTNLGHDGRWRKVRVAVAGQPNVKYNVRTRSGYYAREPAK